MAQAYVDLKQPDEAKRVYRAATVCLERFEQPIQAANTVSHFVTTPWAGLGEAFAPVDDPRRNPFDWEAWHECDVFRRPEKRASVPSRTKVSRRTLPVRHDHLDPPILVHVARHEGNEPADSHDIHRLWPTPPACHLHEDDVAQDGGQNLKNVFDIVIYLHVAKQSAASRAAPVLATLLMS